MITTRPMLAPLLALLSALAPLAASAQTAGSSYLATGALLTNDQYLVSPNGQTFLVMQGDGNLNLYKGSGPSDNKGNIWSSLTGGLPAGTSVFAFMQTDGNFCVYKGKITDTKPPSLWCSGTGGGSGLFYAGPQDSGAWAVFNGASPVMKPGMRWASAKPPTSLTVAPSIDGTISAAPVNGVVGSAVLNCGATCTANYPWWSSVTLTATPAHNHSFASWDGACAGQGNPCTVFLSEALSVTAAFKMACPGSFRSCAPESCTDVSMDPRNCGACGNSCGAGGTICAQGQCVCPHLGLLCNGVCKDTDSDVNNCGACGYVCVGNQLNQAQCASGKCVCPTGFSVCSGACVWLGGDFKNCGACGHVCSSGQCNDGVCVTK